MLFYIITMTYLQKILFGIIFFLIPCSLFAQVKGSPDIVKITDTSPAIPESRAILYAHFDKNIYAINETVWFTSYLTNDEQETRLADFILAMLVDDHRHIVLEQKFLMNKGIASGNIVLPDSLLSGKYKFILYTNTLHSGEPQNIFTQPVVIKGAGSIAASAPTLSPKPKDGPHLQPIVRFYAEGGSLVEGLRCRVALQLKSASKRPFDSRALLFEDGKIVDTITTDKTGTGSFSIVPKGRSSYHVEIVSPLDVKGQKFTLQKAVNNKPVISVRKAVAQDTLEVLIQNGRMEQFQVVVHNLREIFLNIPFVANKQARRLKIALTDLPRGIAEIVLLDSAKKPCAQRLFFAHHSQQNRLVIQTRDSVYKRRQKVEVTLQMTDWKGLPVQGLVSVSCMQSNRLSSLLATDIETNNLWQWPLASFGGKSSFISYPNQDTDDLENLLLTKTWQSEVWIKQQQDHALVKLPSVQAFDVYGKVTRSGKRIKKPVTLILMKDNSLSVIQTDSTGNFTLSNDNLLQPSRKDLRLMIGEKFPKDYEINIQDPYGKISKTLAEGIADQEQWNMVDPTNIDLGLSTPVRTNQLKEVKIVSRRDMSFYGTRKTKNACGDYICKYGFLNCPSHAADPDNTEPTKGTRYKIYIGTNADGSELFRSSFYSGCNVKVYENTKMISGINQSVRYIPQDYSAESISMPELSSTIVWVDSCIVPSSGTVRLTFYTNDLVGRFKIVVQGMAGEDVITGEKIITVVH